ncbi:hypothetical protein AEST_22200 [Alishewanella aestuarii B11]|uniref:DUF3987 domain-containing protein n=1 Tax=Alishewanella aestuarii B11 TaxID=1197174 RepID=J1Q218_9ALTE|nr:DUF3987 domain-containing protein [Alishewanella aestuarii]EJI85118.1 hypothetical protein AEST_22200 [Alishewanella aestuarii B11]
MESLKNISNTNSDLLAGVSDIDLTPDLSALSFVMGYTGSGVNLLIRKDNDEYSSSELKNLINSGNSDFHRLGCKIACDESKADPFFFVRYIDDGEHDEHEFGAFIKDHPEAQLHIKTRTAFEAVYLIDGSRKELEDLKQYLGEKKSIKIYRWFTVKKGAYSVGALSKPMSLYRFYSLMGGKKWIAPKPFREKESPIRMLNQDMMPELLYNYVMSQASLDGTTADYAFAVNTSLIGTSISKFLRVDTGFDDNKFISPNLWTCLVGVAGSGKTPATTSALNTFKRFIVPADKAESNYNLKIDNAIAHATERDIKKEVQTAFDEGKVIDPAKIIKTIGKKVKVLNVEEESVASAEMLLLTDFTPAGFNQLLTGKNVPLVVYADEFRQLLNSLNNNLDMRSLLMQSESGNAILSRKIATAQLKTVKDATVTVITSIQPDAYRPHITEAKNGEQGGNDGLLNRFQLTVVNVTPTTEEFQSQKRLYKKKMLSFLNAIDEFISNALTFDGYKVVKLSKEANVKFNRFKQKLNEVQKKDNLNELMQSHLYKNTGTVLKIALVYELVLNYDDDEKAIKDFSKISSKAMVYAIKTMRYLYSHSKSIFDNAESDVHGGAVDLLNRLTNLDPNIAYTASEISQRDWKGFKRDTSKVEQTLKYIENFGYVKSEKLPKKTVWHIHPLLKVVLKF